MKTGKVVPISRKPPSRNELAKRIRKLVKEGAFSYGTVVFSFQGVDLSDALEVLTAGTIEGEITLGVIAGEWKCKMVGAVDNSSRRLGVVAVIVRDVHLLLTAVGWEDPR